MKFFKRNNYVDEFDQINTKRRNKDSLVVFMVLILFSLPTIFATFYNKSVIFIEVFLFIFYVFLVCAYFSIYLENYIFKRSLFNIDKFKEFSTYWSVKTYNIFRLFLESLLLFFIFIIFIN